MPIKDLFRSDVTRDIPPVVYVHEQSPAKLDAEVSEYIITGGWPSEHPNHRRVPNGIHEEYVRLLTAISNDLKKRNGTDLPACWISGFYGSGKSSFAKLLGLALDGRELPGGRSLAEAWLQRDTSPKARDLQKAWNDLRKSIDPLAVVFDIGATARDNEHIHAAAVRLLQQRLGYSKEAAVADYELKLEREGQWPEFERIAQATLGQPWADVKGKQFAEEEFSRVMAAMYPEHFADPMRWFELHAGTNRRAASPEEAVSAIQDMLKLRKRSATLFLVIDEVSQYLQAHSDRVDRMRAFATALGAKLRGKAWLLALGQQKLEEEAEGSFLDWAKARFPPHLRVHLAPTNIRDVIHKRLLQKKAEAEPALRKLFEQNRPLLKNYAFGCDAITADEFVDVYPMLPGHIDLILQITSALRARSARAQGDDQAIRGLLQLLGELFRTQRLAEKEPGVLVTLDQVYDVQHTALDSDIQDSMARLLGQCTGDSDELKVRAAKAVALLELIQDVRPTDAKLVAQCLYDRVGRGNNVQAVTDALEELRNLNLLGYSEKEGYKIQSTAGEEWERERRDLPVASKTRSELVKDTLVRLIADPEQPRFNGRPFPWAAVYSDGREANDVSVQSPRADAAVWVDFRYATLDEQAESQWVRRSNEEALYNRLVWVIGNRERLDDLAGDLGRSNAMLQKYSGRRDSLSAAKKIQLLQEESRRDGLLKQIQKAAADAWMAGRMYFRGRPFSPKDHGTSFARALEAAGTRILPELFVHFVATQVEPSEIQVLIQPELSAPSPKFLPDELGILELDAGRYVPACSGPVPRRVLEHIEKESGVSGGQLLTHFGKPPYGYTQGVVKACVAGLLRAGRVKLLPDGGNEITAVRDAGVRELLTAGDRDFRRATVYPAGADDIGPRTRAEICRFFEDRLGVRLDREDHLIADAVAQQFPLLARRLREVEERLARLPGRATSGLELDEGPQDEAVFFKLREALERCTHVVRQTKPAVTEVKRRLDTLRDGVQQLKVYEAELTDDAIRAVRYASDVLDYQVHQLRETGAETSEVAEAAKSVSEQLSRATPWRDIAAVEPDLEAIRSAFFVERKHLLAWQEQHAEQARVRVKSRSGFSTLTGDQSHKVLRPLAKAVSDTTPEAVAPSLLELRDRFTLALQRAEDEANDILDGLLSEGDKPMIQTLDLGLRNREVVSEADIEALVEEIRARLLEQLRAGTRVRLI
jgi:hypothetical protein